MSIDRGELEAATLQDSDIVALKLQFGHDCRNLGCNIPGCELCKNNPNRRCQTHFREKYVDNANRVFLARCSAPIMVRVADAITGEEFVDDALDRPHRLEGAQLQLCLLEGLAYEQKEKEKGAENLTPEDFRDMLLLDNQTSARPEPLLVPGKNCPGIHTVDHKLIIDFTEVDGHLEAPVFVRTSRSSQNAQGGRTRPFRMLAQAIWKDGTPISMIMPDVSEPFVVTTRRTQGAEKAVVPRWTDPVGKIPGVGKETCNKMKDLRSAGLSTPLFNYRISTVGDLFNLIDQADINLLNDLGRTLGLKAEKIEELQRNVRLVAREDSRKRIWGSPDYPADRLVYPCESGAPDLLQTHIEVMRDTDDGAEIISTEDLDPVSLQRVIEMRQVAFESWWAPEHPGWGIIEETLPDDVGRPPAAAPEFVQVTSLREQMDRQCKYRRYQEPSPSDSGFASMPESGLDIAESGMTRSVSQSYRPSRIDTESQPSNASNEFDSIAMSAAMPLFPGPRSVFEDAFPVAHDTYQGVDQDANAFARSRDRPTNSAAQDINNAPSYGQLIDQPVGLAYITSAPGLEINGPIRFKRSVSGNRYKAPNNDHGIGWMNPQQGYENGQDVSRPQATPSPGVFVGLPPRPSKELRSQTSLDKVANWQQTRSISSGTLAERFTLTEHLSGGLWQGLLDELKVNYDEAGELGL